jgi:hypothetical protein
VEAPPAAGGRPASRELAEPPELLAVEESPELAPSKAVPAEKAGPPHASKQSATSTIKTEIQ